jgi:DNA (cytosine-5)-methyltransferase 1
MVKFVDLFAGIGGIRLGFEQAMQELGLNPNAFYHPKSIKTLNRLTRKILEINQREIFTVSKNSPNLTFY